MKNNELKSLHDLVSLDAWHTEFDSTNNTASIHIDVSFSTAKMGEAPSDPVQFELSLKKAEIVTVIPETEGLTVIQSSVFREPVVEAIQSISNQTDISTDAGLGGAIYMSAGSNGAHFDAKAAKGKHSSTQTNTQITARYDGFKINQSRDAGGHYRWKVENALENKILHGKPWDPMRAPLLRVKKTGKQKVDPSCRIQVRCRREDLNIENIKKKNGTLSSYLPKNKLAAEALIVNELKNNGLSCSEISGDFSKITIADSIVCPEVK